MDNLAVHRHEQPCRLEISALNVLSTYVGCQVAQLARHCGTSTLRSSIDILKSEICVCVPSSLFVEFSRKVLEKISSKMSEQETKLRLKQHGASYLEIIMDNKLQKLSEYPEISKELVKLLWSNIHRFTKLKYLGIELHRFEERFFRLADISSYYLDILRRCDLKQLTTFSCPRYCTNDILKLVSKNCPNLDTLHVNYSEFVTPLGLRSLEQCSELRALDINECTLDSQSVLDVLTTNQKIEVLTFNYRDNAGFEFLFESGIVYPRLQKLEFLQVSLTKANLRGVMTMFPNLSSLVVDDIVDDGVSTDDLGDLQSLHLYHYDMHLDANVLVIFGEKIVALTMTCVIKPNDLDVIYKWCDNLQVLHVMVSSTKSQTVVVPPFRKVTCLTLAGITNSVHHANLIFSPMLSLESLYYSCLNFPIDKLESLMLDFEHFPRLSEISNPDMRQKDQAYIRLVAKSNNLNINLVLGNN